VVEARGRQNLALDQTLFLQHGFHVSTRVSRVNDGVAYWKFAILADIGIETHNVYVLYGLLSLADLAMQPHGLSSTPV
jgi:hypothetical protein